MAEAAEEAAEEQGDASPLGTIAWASNSPALPSGYGQQTALVGPHIKRLGYDLAYIATHGAVHPIAFDGCMVYPQSVRHRFSQDVIGPYSAHAGADFTVIFLDAWVCEPHRYTPEARQAGWADYTARPVLLFPVDHEPVPERVADAVRSAWGAIAYTRFGQREAQKAGLAVHYVPHAVDTAALAPMGRAEARAHIGLEGLGDRFVVGVVAANHDAPPTRKNWEGIFGGFARFRAEVCPDAALYVHGPIEGGCDLKALMKSFGLANCGAVLAPHQTQLRLGFDAEHLRATYNAFDVLLAPSMGEGFGLPILEAQACGTPVITGAWTAMEELCFAGRLIPKAKAVPMWTPLNAYQWRVGAEVVAEYLADFYREWQTQPDRSAMQAAAREGASAYDIEVVTERYWKPVLAELMARAKAEQFQEEYARAAAQAKEGVAADA